MRKSNLSIISFSIGVGLFFMWASGSHGPNPLEFHSDRFSDWTLLLVLIVCFAIPIYHLIRWALKKLN